MDGRALDFWIREGHRARALRQLAALEAAFFPHMEAEHREQILARYNEILNPPTEEQGRPPSEDQEAEWERNRGELNAILSMRG